MQPPLVGIDLRWFDASYGTGMKFGNHGLDFTYVSIPIDETAEQSHIEMMQLALGTNLYKAVCCLNADSVGMWTPLMDIKGEAVEPLFHVLSAWNGRALLHDRRVNTEMRFGEGQCTFQFIDGFDQRVMASGDGAIESESFVIGYSTLCQLLGRSNTLELLARLGVAKVQSANALPVPRHICAILHACFTSPFTGNLRKLHAQAKLLEFLCALAGHFSRNLPRQSKQYKPDLLQHMHQELTRLEGAPPCVDELSRRYGLSARALKKAFKEEYGQSIHAFVKNYRLDYAHASLQNTKRPLKLVAAQLGYSHVNHFINAFSKKFGYPPGSINQRANC